MNISSIKSILIILVVIGHLIQYTIDKDFYINNYFYQLIYSFHMPAFMFISGYLFKKRSIDKFYKYIIIYLITGLAVLDKDFKILISNPDEGFWYFYILAIFYLFYNSLNSQKNLFIFLLFSIILIYFKIDLRYLLYYIIFFSAGIYFKLKINSIKYFLNLYINKYINIFLILFMIFLPLIFPNLKEQDIFLLLFYRIILPVLSIIIIIRNLKFYNSNKYINAIAKNTGLIYIYHLIYFYKIEINYLTVTALIISTLILCIKINRH